MSCQGLLLFCKRHRRRWRRPLRYYLPIHYGLRRRSHMTSRRSFRSHHGLLRGNYGNSGAHRRPGNLLWSYRNCRVGHGLRGGKGALWNHRHRALNIPVRIVHVRDVGGPIIDDGVVVNVRDGRGVDRGVADVHLVHVATADLVRRHVNFSRTQREPSHIAAETDTDAASTSTDEDDQCRCIYGTHVHRSGDPAPTPAEDCPASVVIRARSPTRRHRPRCIPRVRSSPSGPRDTAPSLAATLFGYQTWP